jgi:hypothetical protein
MWLDTLGEREQKRVLHVMGLLRARSSRALEASAALDIRPADLIAFGSEHVHDYLKGIGLSEFLRNLNHGESPSIAADHAREYLQEIICHWNAAREWQQHLSLDAGAEHIQAAEIWLATVIENKQEGA